MRPSCILRDEGGQSHSNFEGAHTAQHEVGQALREGRRIGWQFTIKDVRLG